MWSQRRSQPRQGPGEDLEREGSTERLITVSADSRNQGKVMDHVQGPSGEASGEQLEKGARDRPGYVTTTYVCRFLS